VRENNIVFFDGVCGLCNSFIDFLIRRNGGGKLMFSPLQGATAKRLISSEYIETMETVVFVRRNKTYVKSTAVLKILMQLGGPWRLLFIFFAVPVFVRNYLYKAISNKRYDWFGKRENCRLPSPEERHWFLP
jgi:predicted DCC family thiol-disulfide oxidoreductase YuxK